MKESESSVSYKLTLILFILYTIFQVLDKTQVVALDSGLSYKISVYSFGLMIVLLFFSIKIIFYSLKNIFIFVVLFIFALLLFEKQGYNVLFFSIFSMFLTPKLGFKNLIKWNLIVRTCITAGVVLLSLFSILPSGDAYDSTSGHVRLALGFSNPNGLAESVLVLFLLSMLYKRYLNDKFLLCFYATMFILLVVSRSRTIILIAVLVFGLSKIVEKDSFFFEKHSIFRLFLICLPVVCSAMSYHLMVLYNSGIREWVSKIDTFMSNRLLLGGYYVSHVIPAAFGQRLSIANVSIGGHFFATASLDNGYVSLLLRYGYVSLILILIMLTYLIVKSTNNNYVNLLPAVIAFVVIGISETGVYLIAYNFTFYFLGIFLDSASRKNYLRL